jgi:hypothetical protein
MVELELLQSCERAIPLLDELQPPALERSRLIEEVTCRFRLAEKGPGDEENRDEREPRAEDEREGHAGAAA